MRRLAAKTSTAARPKVLFPESITFKIKGFKSLFPEN